MRVSVSVYVHRRIISNAGAHMPKQIEISIFPQQKRINEFICACLTLCANQTPVDRFTC